MPKSAAFFAFFAATLIGCNASEIKNRCEFEKFSTEPLQISLKGSSDVKFLDISTELIAMVHLCHSQQPYKGPVHQLSFGQEKILADGQRVLLFGMRGISDVELAVLIDQQGKFVRSGTVSVNY